MADMRRQDGLPTLSVVVNNYNYADYLREALDSVLAQLEKGDELVVVDDGSTDKSREILVGYIDAPGVTIIEQENQGQSAAIFRGLARARGDLCLLLDSDDWYLPGYLKRIRQLAHAHPEAALLFCAYQIGGDNHAGVRHMQTMQTRMVLEEGVTGVSRCSTLVTGEYLGSPTSGLALRQSLVGQLLQAQERIPDYMPIHPRLARWLGFPSGSHTAVRLAADGIIVRAASLAGYNKYFASEPGFFYRIHGSNAFASISWLGRQYLRAQRSRQVVRLTAGALGVEGKPTLAEVTQEAAQRSRPRRLRRRLRLRLNYVLAVLVACGDWWRKPGAVRQVWRSLC